MLNFASQMKKPLLFAVSAIFLHACATNSTQPSSLLSSDKQTAKNVILFIGDGMGVSTVTATRIFDGQSRGETGEENTLSFEKFPHVALVKTYNTNQQVSDSAGTATALNTGVKTKAGVLGVGPGADRESCVEAQEHRLETLGEIAVRNDKAVGIVTTARLTHATPAAVYAHSPERDWETDASLTALVRSQGCTDIAEQLIEFPFDIALGGGAENFRGTGLGGTRLDPSENLIQDWVSVAPNRQAVYNKSDLQSVNSSGQVLGAFSESHMTFMVDKAASSLEPTLTEMTAAALSHLDKKDEGYYLMIEGGRIDHGHHKGRAGYALTEGQEFARAVAYAKANTDPKETLILVTADHSHVFTIAGYPTRGNDILGVVKGNDDRGRPTGEALLATDGLPYTTLGYWNGPGASGEKRAYPPTGVSAHQQAVIPTGSGFDKTAKQSETHGGEDVAIYATGPGSDRVHGVMEQNKIFDVIVSAFGW